VEVGTGSGCVAVALASEFPTARVIATDISESALAVARRNAARNGAADRIEFRAGDLLEPVSEAANLIVANLPYVASGDAPGLVPEVREHEPHVALFGGDDGLQIFRRLFPLAATRLAAGGWLVVEVGYDQDDRVAAIAARDGWRLSHVRQDLQAITRTLIFTRAVIMADCLFCKIASREIRASLVYEDDLMFVLDDIKPQAPMHALVIPKRHIPTLNALRPEDEALIGAMMRRAAAVAAERGYAERGYRTVFNTNADSGQAVYHIHLHVLGGRPLSWPPG
jgi:histidine triad (HIT) family protein